MSPADRDKATEIAIGALKTIQRITHVSGDKAQDALQAIDAIIVSLRDGLEGRTTPDIVEAELRAIVNGIVDTVTVTGRDDIGTKFDNGGES